MFGQLAALEGLVAGRVQRVAEYTAVCSHLRQPLLLLESGGGGPERGLGHLDPLFQVLEKVLAGLPEGGLFRLELLVPTVVCIDRYVQ